MDEKIKIFLSQKTMNILQKDMEFFEFYKKDGSLNKNEFYNTVLVNYYESFQNRKMKIHKDISKILTMAVNNPKERTDVVFQITSYLNKITEADDDENKISTSFTPNVKSKQILDFIERYVYSDESSYRTISVYLRDLFSNYISVPLNKREEIIFRDTFKTLNDAIELNAKVYITLTNGHSFEASPYKIVSSKDELCNYLLCNDGIPSSKRISRIKSVQILNEMSELTDSDIGALKQIEYNGPQFYLSFCDDIQVKLNDAGKKMFKRIYWQRPIPTKVEGDIYHFACSLVQVEQYFTRFKDAAVIIKPVELKEKMIDDCEKVLKQYK